MDLTKNYIKDRKYILRKNVGYVNYSKLCINLLIPG